MREILFRGKRIDNDKWVYGSFCMDAVEQLNGLCGVDGFIRLYDKAKGKMQMYEVDRETVGQYTGLTDKNGKRIFEGDIVKHDFGEDQIGVQYAVVKYDGKYASFMIKPLYDWMSCDKEDCEVIGNIHDNPELVKEG